MSYVSLITKKLKKYIKYNIVSQCLSQERLGEDVITDNKDVYNKITTTMFNLQKKKSCLKKIIYLIIRR